VSAHRQLGGGSLAWLAVIAVIQLLAAVVVAGAGAAALDAYRHHNVTGMAVNTATFVAMYVLVVASSALGRRV
jgi:uncharacterized membrane protein